VTYLEQNRSRAERELEKNRSIFGLMGGTILVLFGGLAWLSATPGSIWSAVFVGLVALGFVVFALGLIAPALLKYPYKAFRAWGNFMGKAVFSIILAVIYVVFVFPVGLLLRNKRGESGYAAWQQPSSCSRSTFCDIANIETSNIASTSYLGIMHRLLCAFVANKQYVLIPVVVVLVLLGLVFFFISSNVVTAFVYAIF